MKRFKQNKKEKLSFLYLFYDILNSSHHMIIPFFLDVFFRRGLSLEFR